jgi:hypothetical protein
LAGCPEIVSIVVGLLALYEIAIEFRCLPFSSDGTDALHQAVSSYLQSKGNAQMYYNAQLRLPMLADLKVTPSDWLVDGRHSCWREERASGLESKVVGVLEEVPRRE